MTGESDSVRKASPTWVKFGGENHAENLFFLGKDILAIGQSSYILFINTKGNESEGEDSYCIYKADGVDNRADGVACMAAHGVVPLFAVAENKLKGQIYLLAYPTFAQVSKLKCVALIGYQALAFAEGDVLISLSQQPEFVLTIWNWIIGEEIKTVKTETLTLNQQLRCTSNSPILISQSSEELNELKIWEVSICYSTCHVVEKRVDLPAAKCCSLCWAPEGILWLLNDQGDIYSIDPQSYIPKLFYRGESCFNFQDLKPSIRFHRTSLVVTTPDGFLKVFKKQKGVLHNYPVDYEIKTPISKLTSPIDSNILAGWTTKGEVVKVITPQQIEEEKCLECPVLCKFGEAIFDMGIIQPDEEYLATVSRKEELNIWKMSTGELVSELRTVTSCMAMALHPTLPVVAVGGNDGIVQFINLSTITSPSTLCLHLLDHLQITSLTFDKTGDYVVAASLPKGIFFVLKVNPESKDFCEAIKYLRLEKEVASCCIMRSPAKTQLVLLLPPPEEKQQSEDVPVCEDVVLEIEDEDSEEVIQTVSMTTDETNEERASSWPAQQFLVYNISGEANSNGRMVVDGEEHILRADECETLTVVLNKCRKESDQVITNYYSHLGQSGCPPLKEDQLFAFPEQSNQIHILAIDSENVGSQSEPKLVTTLQTGHQVRCSGDEVKTVQIGSLQINSEFLLTYGADGLIFLHPHSGGKRTAEPIILKTHHYINAGIRKAECNSTGTSVISLGWDGCLVGIKIGTENEMETQEKSETHLKLTEKQSKLMRVLQSIRPKELSEFSKTWLELKAEEKVLHEMLTSAPEKSRIWEDFQDIKAEVNDLINRNDRILESEHLPLEKFELDREWRQERLSKGETERQEEERKMQNTLSEYQEKAKALRQECWEPMAVKGKLIKGVLCEIEVENYPLFPDDPDFEEKVGQAVERRTMEIEFTFKERFTPWMPRSDSYNERLLQQGQDKLPSKVSVEQDERTRLYMAMMSEDDEDFEDDLEVGEKEEKEPSTASETNMEIFEWSGSVSHKFVTIPQCLHSQQLELYALNSLYNETILLEFINEKLRKYFNTELEKTMDLKILTMQKAAERIARLKEIQSEHKWCLTALSREILGHRFSLPQAIKRPSIKEIPLVTSTTVFEPKWIPQEKPETGIMSVDDDEVDAIPYITPEEAALRAERAKEAERLRRLREADNFRELALIEMMDGVLIVRWEDVIKKDVPRPAFMDMKDPGDWTEAEIRQHKEYENKVQFLQSERDRYRKLLEHEFETRNEDLMRELNRFDKSLLELHKLKHNVDASTIQETMKMIGMQLRNDKLNSLKAREKQLMKEISAVKDEEENIDLELQELQQALRACTEIYESLTQRDKHLDTAFRKEGGEYSAAVSEQRHKLFKRRPKNLPRSALALTLITEVWKLHGCKPESWKESTSSQLEQRKMDHIPAIGDLLTQDSIDFLQTLDTMDGLANSFPGIDEEAWMTLCKHRRVKLQNEIKAKSAAHELAESENANKQCQKTLDTLKVKENRLQEELNNVRISKLDLCHNAQVQLIMKNGNIELGLTGCLADFSDAILIHRSVIEKVNEIIVKSGEAKLKAMQNFADFRRKVLLKEWEHKKLKLQSQDLVDHIDLVDRTKVTKDMLEHLAKEESGEKSPKTRDKDGLGVKEIYKKKFQAIQGKIHELEIRIVTKEKENHKLDNAIRSLNVDVNEQLLQCDPLLEEKHAKAIGARMSALVHRSKLVNEIQQQHNDILILQTELELLRLKTFPTFKYVEIK